MPKPSEGVPRHGADHRGRSQHLIGSQHAMLRSRRIQLHARTYAPPHRTAARLDESRGRLGIKLVQRHRRQASTTPRAMNQTVRQRPGQMAARKQRPDLDSRPRMPADAIATHRGMAVGACRSQSTTVRREGTHAAAAAPSRGGLATEDRKPQSCRPIPQRNRFPRQHAAYQVERRPCCGYASGTPAH